MRKELRRSLFAAAFAGVALADCGGNSSSSNTSSGVPAPSPTPSPSPTPTSAGTYLMMASAGPSSTTVASIPFADTVALGGTAPSPFGLSYIDPNNLPPPFSVDQAQFQVEAGGTVLPLAAVSEYFPNGAGSATAWGTRFRVYAKASSNSSGLLYAVDLRESTSPPAVPTPVQLTSSTIAAMQLCSTAAVTFDNYRSANLSWILFHVLGPDGNCGTLDDQYLAVQLSMGPTSMPKTLAQLEPVEATYDGEGTVTGYLAINHPPVSNGVPTTAVPLQHLDTNFAAITTPALPNLVGTGLNIGGGDFLSLAVSGSVWLYLDSSGIYALNISTGTVSSALVTLGTGDTVSGRAVVDGIKAYVAINNNSGAGAEIVQIDLSTNAVATVARDTTLSAIKLVGVTSGALVYFGTTTTGVTNLRSAVKSTLVANPTPLIALSGSQTIDSLMGPNGAASTTPTPVAFLVGDTVFFTVADSSASGTTGLSKQAFYVTIDSSGTPSPAAAIAANVSAVLGAVSPSPLSTSGANTNIGALVLTMGGNAGTGATAPGGAVFAVGTPATAASLGLYSATGVPVQTVLGSLSSTSLGTGVALTEPIYSVAFDNGPVQSGMPAMLELTGTAGGSPAEDIAVYTPNTASSLTQLSGFSE
jgi:hypothetical protein